MKKTASIIYIIIIIILIFAIIILGKTVYANMLSPVIAQEEYNINITNTNVENTINNNDVKKEISILECIKNNVHKVIDEIFNKEENIEQKNNENKIAILEDHFFYNQLNDNQKIIYTALQKNKDNLMTGNYTIDFGDTFSELLSEENGKDILNANYQTAIEAFLHDYPEIFYVDVNKMYINIDTITKLKGTKYEVYISSKKGETYYKDGFESYEQVVEANSNIESIKNNIVSTLTGTDYQKIKYIHDYLVDNIEYATDYNNAVRYTVYGALIEKKCVCEGYAKAFKYLLNSAGINCEIIQGKSTNSSGSTENHAWNCVELGGVWYQIDVTWDDPIIIGSGFLNNKHKYAYFLKGTMSFEKDHSIENQFSKDGKIFKYPDLNESDYD